MDKIPAEILGLVVSHLEPPLANLARISSRWQAAIERRTFSSITLETAADGDGPLLGEFEGILASPRRRALLQKLHFKVQLPSPSEKRMRKLQGRREAAVNNAVFTRAILALFSHLHAWGEGARVALVVTAFSPADDYGSELEDVYPHGGEPIWRIRNCYRYLGFDSDLLQSAGGLPPSAPAITELTIGGPSLFTRRIDPAALSLLVNALPKVTAMDWSFFSPPRRLPDLRRAIRMSLADALIATVAANLELLTTLHIYWEDIDPFNEAFDPGSLVDPASGRDRLSIALHRLSQLPSLRHLKLTGCHVVGAEVFDGEVCDTTTNSRLPTPWPALESFEMDISITTPDGRWYLTGDPSSAEPTEELVDDDSDESVAAFDSADSDASDFAPERAWDREDGMIPGCSFRFAPDTEIMVPFLLSIARAVPRMPMLRRLGVWMGNAGSGSTVYLDYFGPNQRRAEGMVDAEAAFHEEHLADRRWVLFLNFPDADPPARWEIPQKLRTALTETSGDGCVYIMGSQQDQF